MGSEARIVVYGTTQESAMAACEKAFGRMEEVEGVLSDWRVDSEVVTLREAHPHEPVDISADFAEVIQLSIEINNWTGGGFDPACGRMTQEWRAAKSRSRSPRNWSTYVAEHGPGASRLQLKGDHIVFAEPVPWLDFGGIGKGWAADEALRALEQAGVTRALVDLGGELAIGAPPPGAKGWAVKGPAGIELFLHNCGVATSGAGEQHLQVEGQFASHVLDPRSGHWLGQHVDVTVVAPSAAVADALASAGCVLGADELRRSVAGDGLIILD